MWGLILHINGVLLALSGAYLVYSIGASILTWSWKQFVVALVIFIFFGLAEVALAGLAEP